MNISHSEVKKKFIRVIYEYNKNPDDEIKESFKIIHKLYLSGYDSSKVYMITLEEHNQILETSNNEFRKVFNEYLVAQREYLEINKNQN